MLTNPEKVATIFKVLTTSSFDTARDTLSNLVFCYLFVRTAPEKEKLEWSGQEVGVSCYYIRMSRCKKLWNHHNNCVYCSYT